MDILPRIGSMARKSGGKCTAYPTERRMLMTVVRAVPWSSQIENREKSRERCYLPVCSRLTREGTGSKGLMVTRIEAPGNAGRLFFILWINEKKANTYTLLLIEYYFRRKARGYRCLIFLTKRGL